MATEEPQKEEQGPLPRTREAVDWWLEKWGRTEPLTRQDVNRLIEANGGTAIGVNLEGRDLQGSVLEDANLQGVNLREANLQGAYLGWADLQNAHLSEAKLQGAELRYSDLQDIRLFDANLQDAGLNGANLEGADLRYANLDGANFGGFRQGGWTNMEGVRLHGATIMETTKLRRVLWCERMTFGDELDKRWEEAIEPYRDLKQWYQRTGDYDTAGRFHYQEWECRRKLAQHEKKPVEILDLWLYRLLSGYGERPWRVIGVVAVLIALFALFYVPWIHVGLSTATGLRGFFTQSWKALYFSGVFFTALGYGGWVESEGIVPTGLTRYLGGVQSLFGISLIALFLVTFTRKMSRQEKTNPCA